MYLITMQTLLNQIPLGPAEMINLLNLFGWVRFLFLLNMYMSWQKKVSVPKDFGLVLSNIMCEYEVNPLTNDKVITEIQNFNAKW